MWRALICAMMLILGGCVTPALREGVPVTQYVYQLGVGDTLKIAVFGEDSLSGDYTVNADGAVAFPLVGMVEAKGRSLADFKQDLETKLGSQYLRNPQVRIEMAGFRPVYILGEVARPGEFAYVERLSVYALVAKAGGFTYRADERYAYIRNENATTEKAIRLDSSTAVAPGDTVRIPERNF